MHCRELHQCNIHHTITSPCTYRTIHNYITVKVSHNTQSHSSIQKCHTTVAPAPVETEAEHTQRSLTSHDPRDMWRQQSDVKYTGRKTSLPATEQRHDIWLEDNTAQHEDLSQMRQYRIQPRTLWKHDYENTMAELTRLEIEAEYIYIYICRRIRKLEIKSKIKVVEQNWLQVFFQCQITKLAFCIWVKVGSII